MSFGSEKASVTKRLVVVTAVVMVTIAAGALHGHLEHRWGSPHDLEVLATQLEQLPTNVGSWRLENSAEISPDVQEMLRCAGYVNRTYVHHSTGATARVAVLLGPTTPIAIHTPEICFSSRASVIHKPRQRVTIEASDGQKNELWHLVFRPSSGVPDDMHVFYAWSRGEDWIAPESQRLEFVGAPWLYKIQLAIRTPEDAPTDGQAVGSDFLARFLPALHQAMLLSTTSERLGDLAND